MQKYDIIVIGAGLGGLTVATMLVKEGYKVCVLEQHSVIGGCLQSFTRNGRILDTGLHYVGGLSEGQVTNQLFKYLGIIDKLDLYKLDEDGFEIIRFPNNDTEYRYVMGIDAFTNQMKEYFPKEKDALDKYRNLLEDIGKIVSIEGLKSGKIANTGKDYMYSSAYNVLNNLTDNERMCKVLAATNSLYDGDCDKSSIYVHGMVNFTNIEGAYRFRNGTQHIADELVAIIRKGGGEVLSSSKVTGIFLNGYDIDFLEVNNEERVYADNYISAIHPTVTYSLLRNNTVLRKINLSRILNLENTRGVYTLYMLPKPNTIKYKNRNYYIYLQDEVWKKYKSEDTTSISSFLLSMQPPQSGEYVNVISVMVMMSFDLLKKWENTTIGKRGADYMEFKDRYNELLISKVYEQFPEFRGSIEKIYSSSPLTYRDYTGTPGGSAYGVIKDCRNPLFSHLPVRGKIRNLFFTGQNLNVHGCLGVILSSVVTASQFMGVENISKKIGNA